MRADFKEMSSSRSAPITPAQQRIADPGLQHFRMPTKRVLRCMRDVNAPDVEGHRVKIWRVVNQVIVFIDGERNCPGLAARYRDPAVSPREVSGVAAIRAVQGDDLAARV